MTDWLDIDEYAGLSEAERAGSDFPGEAARVTAFYEMPVTVQRIKDAMGTLEKRWPASHFELRLQDAAIYKNCLKLVFTVGASKPPYPKEK